ERVQERFAELGQAPQLPNTLALEAVVELSVGALQRLGKAAHQGELALAQHALDELADAGLGLVEVAALSGPPGLAHRAPFHELAQGHAHGPGAHVELFAKFGGAE